MKIETLSIRLTPEDKQLISDLAWQRRMSMAQLIVTLAHEAEEFQRPGSASGCGFCRFSDGNGGCSHETVGNQEKVRIYPTCTMFE